MRWRYKNSFVWNDFRDTLYLTKDYMNLRYFIYSISFSYQIRVHISPIQNWHIFPRVTWICYGNIEKMSQRKLFSCNVYAEDIYRKILIQIIKNGKHISFIYSSSIRNDACFIMHGCLFVCLTWASIRALLWITDLHLYHCN
jgi:hypothetical protein